MVNITHRKTRYSGVIDVRYPYLPTFSEAQNSLYEKYQPLKRLGKMSRHKLVKSLNLEDEIDDFDGGANYDEVDGERKQYPS